MNLTRKGIFFVYLLSIFLSSIIYSGIMIISNDFNFNNELSEKKVQNRNNLKISASQEPLWTKSVQGEVTSVSISYDGNYIAVGTHHFPDH